MIQIIWVDQVDLHQTNLIKNSCIILDFNLTMEAHQCHSISSRIISIPMVVNLMNICTLVEDMMAVLTKDDAIIRIHLIIKTMEVITIITQDMNRDAPGGPAD